MCTEKEIAEMKFKTYIYFLSVLLGVLAINAILCTNTFFSITSEYLIYHNNVDDNGGKLLHYVNAKLIPIYGILSILFDAVLIILTMFYIKLMRKIENKKKSIIISIILMIFSAIVLGFVSIVVLDFFISHYS